MPAPRKLRWLAVGAYVAVIFATVPVAPRLWLGLSHMTGLELEPLAQSILLVAGGLVCLPALTRPRPARIVGVALVAALYVAAYRLPFEAPAERLHLLEYGLLPGMIAWALGDCWALTLRLLVGVAGGAIIGAVDEGLQALTPGRFGQGADVALNATSSALGALAVRVVGTRQPRPF